MKWLGLTLLVVAVAGGATAYAFGGSTGAGQAAYALVDPNGGTPRLVDAHTSGFVAVSVGVAGQGDYCLTPAPGVNVVDTAAVASEEAFYSNAAGFVTVRYPPSPQNCAAGQLEIKTFDQNVALSNQIAFTVDVP